MKKNISRDAGLDLLRIISMIMVVTLHFYNHGGLVYGTLVQGTANWYAGRLVYALCNVSVNCFVLLSGYFQCTSKFKLKRVVSIWVQALFYCVALYVLEMALGGSFSIKQLIKSGMVVTLNQYWFVTAYLLMYAVSPFLNCAVQAMNKRMHMLCCGVLLGIFSVLHNLVYISDFGHVQNGYSFLWFCVLYVVAAYIRLYVPAEKGTRKRLLLGYFVCAEMIAVEHFAACYITPLIFGRVIMENLFNSYNSIMTTAASIALFMAMRTVRVEQKGLTRVIGFFAPLAFGVYLIHDHHAVRPLLWQWLDPAEKAESAWMLPYMAVCVLGIFTVCCLIEWVRQWVFRECKIDGLIARVCDRVQTKVSAWQGAEDKKSAAE